MSIVNADACHETVTPSSQLPVLLEVYGPLYGNVIKSDLCEKGNAKSHTNSDIVSFIWALDTSTGTPVTYFVNNGGMVDSNAL